MKMDRPSLAFARICFFVMLFISTACNKMDRSMLRDDFSSASPAATAPAAATADAERLRELEGRVAQLEAELKNAASGGESSSLQTRAYWD